MSLREVNKKLTEFRNLKLDPRSEASTRWFATNLSKIQSNMRPEIYNRSHPAASSPLVANPGSMVFFGYSPKTKDELPFWDEFPLVVILAKSRGSVLGLNLHYLRPNERALFLNFLIRAVDNPNYHRNPPAYMKMTYLQLKGSPMAKIMRKAIKRYLVSHVRTKVNIIPSTEWKLTTFLPVDKFKGATRDQVWAWMTKYTKG